MITALLVDDEPMDARYLETLLNEEFPEIKVLAKAISIKDGLKLITETVPQLLLLDIDLPDGTGFDLLQQINLQDFEIIFISAFDSHAMQVLKNGAIDYIVKPVTIASLQEAIQKVITKIALKHDAQKFIALQKENKNTTLAIPTLAGEKLVLLSDICFLKAESNYTTLGLKSGIQHLLSHHLKYYEEKLNEHNYFLRVHRSYLVNLKQVIQHKKGRGGHLLLKDNTVIPIAEDKHKEITQRMKQIGKML
jgi:two-component system LytT family response regulator